MFPLRSSPLCDSSYLRRAPGFACALSLDSGNYLHRRSSATTSSKTSAFSASSQTSALAAAHPRDTFTRTRHGVFPAFRSKRPPFRRSEGPSRNSRFRRGHRCIDVRARVTSRLLVDGSRIRLGQGSKRYRWRNFRRWGCVSSCVMLFGVVFCSYLSIHVTSRAGLARPIDSVGVSAVQNSSKGRAGQRETNGTTRLYSTSL